MFKEKMILIVLFIILIVVLGFIYYYKAKSTDGYDFEIHFFNAGKADAILLSKNDHYIMIDTGEESLSTEIIQYFEQHNITKLDYLIITHFDKDHVGSAATIINSIEVGEVLQSNVPKESEYYTAYLEALDAKGITPITVTGDYSLSFTGLEITVNGPTRVYDSNESNNSSLIISVVDGDNSFLFMGDAQNARIKDFLSTNSAEYDFLKVPYHGNYLKRLDNLLETKNIKYAVITSSDEEKEAEETITMLEKYSIEYYLTRNGSLTVLSNGTNIKINQ